MIKNYTSSSVGKKQIVAITGLLLVLFLIFHLSMNLLIFAGPELYNYFPSLAHENWILLRLTEAGLAALFFTHIGFTVSLVLQNKRARKAYDTFSPKVSRSLATRLMPITGTILLLFLIFHIKDYSLADHHGPASMVNGDDLGLYGLVQNTMSNPIRMIGYVIAMFAVGFHLSHGIQSVCQSLGFHDPKLVKRMKQISTSIGIIFALLFSSIPLYLGLIAK